MDLKNAEIRNFYYLGNEKGDVNAKSHEFSVPHFQRPFSWEEDRIKLLVEDLFKHINSLEEFDRVNEEKSAYFAGAIVTVAKNEQGKQSLIDGQQRFTTIYLANYVRYMLYAFRFNFAFVNNQIGIMRDIAKYIRCKKYLANIDPDAEQGSLDKNIESLLENKRNEDNETVEKKNKKSAKATESKNNTEVEKIKELFQLPYLFDLPPEADESYSKERKTQFIKYFKQKLLLCYDRQSFNDNLLSAMSAVYVYSNKFGQLKLKVMEQELSNERTKKYIEAIEALFEVFCEQIVEDLSKDHPTKKAAKKAEQMIQKIDIFLESLNVCVIQTGKEDDAYTLFEVLNDRALALDDLDIIKNYFYKKFVQSNTSKSGEEHEGINDVIEKQERVWGEEVFNDKTKQYMKDLVAFTTLCYLSGEKSLKNEKGKNFRNALKDYLDKQRKSYSSKDLVADFEAFYLAKALLEGCQLPGNKKIHEAMKQMLDQGSSYTKKAITLLYALQLDGVLPALVSPILKKAFSKKQDERLEWIKGLLQKKQAEKQYAELEKLSFYIIRLVLAAKDYKEPREIVAEHIIKQFSVIGDEEQITKPLIDRFSDRVSALLKTFEEWAEIWRYHEKKQGDKIRILFLMLVQCTKNKNLLTFNAQFSTNAPSPDNLNLDHLEPLNPDQNSLDAYFEHDDRSNYVNRLGNMMILDKTSNQKKSNDPMNTFFSRVEENGLRDHWLTKQIEELLEKNHTKSKSGKHKVPKAEFFDQRRESLIKHMKAILGAKFDDKNATVK